jgi:hypothetical protein
MIRGLSCIALAMGFFALNGGLAQAATGVRPGPSELDQGQPKAQQEPAATKQFGAQKTPRGGNPLWGVPIGLLSATRERPLFSPTRRPPAPPVMAEASPPPPPPPPPEPEKPQLMLLGTVTGEPQSIAVVRDQATSSLLRLHVGEAVSGWSLRSVDSRAMTVEKDSQTVTLSLPAPGSMPGLAPPGQFPVQQAFRMRRHVGYER